MILTYIRLGLSVLKHLVSIYLCVRVFCAAVGMWALAHEEVLLFFVLLMAKWFSEEPTKE